VAEQLARLQAALGGRYTVERELGRGGMATVYVAQDLRHHRRVAIKTVRPDLAAALGPERFVREIEIAAGLSHPHILPVYDSGASGGVLFYVMPLVEGESLRTRLDRERQLPLDDVLQIAREVADALAYAHAHDVVHRDIKPENILLHSGHAVVADFGVARAITVAGGERLTGTGIVMGTPAYMSPEQASGDPHLDGRSDIYSLACVVYEMLGGEPPHTGPSPQAILARQLAGEVRSLRPLRSTVSPSLDEALRRALAPAPADRFATALLFAEALAAGASAPARRATVGIGRLVQRVTLGLTAAGALFLLGRRIVGGGAGAPAGLGLAVFPFRAAGAGAEQWSETLPDFLATALDGTPGTRVVDPWALWRPLRPGRTAPAASPDPVDAQRLAAQAGANRYVLGSILGEVSRLELSIRIYRTGALEPLATFAVSGTGDSLTVLVQRLAVEIIAHVGEGPQVANVPDLDRYATRSAEALKAYLRAKEALRRGLVDSAQASIDRALALDSNFALALVEAVHIKSWAQFMQGQAYEGLMGLAERAVRHSDSLSERQRLRARAMLADVRTDGVMAAEALERLVRLDSTDAEAWRSLAYCHLVYGWQYGEGPAAAAAASERAVRLDSTNVPALVNRAWLAVALSDPPDIRRQIARLQAADTGSVLVRGMLLALRAVLDSDAEFARLTEILASSAPAEWISVLRSTRAYRPDRAELLLRRLRRVNAPGFPNRAVVGASAQMAIAEGRLAEIDSASRAGAYREFAAFERTLDRFLVASAIAGIGDSGPVAHALGRLAVYMPPESALARFQTHPVWATGWVVGAWHAMYGDTALVRRWRVALGTLPAGAMPGDWRGALQADFDARLAVRRGDLRDGFRLARRAYDLWGVHTENQLEALPEPAMRFHLAMLLRATGKPDSAATLLRSLIPPTTWLGFYTVRSWYELGEIAEAERRATDAARYYNAALSYWELAGAGQPEWRARTRAALRRVVKEPRTGGG